MQLNRIAARALRLQPPTHSVRWESTRTPMRDGISLATDVAHPDGQAAGPVVVMRTPYGRSGLTGLPNRAAALFLAGHGYHTVVQDVRGRAGSEGVFEPFVQEGPDGYDTVEWVLAQPWCDGRVAALGSSYNGAAAWGTATHPGVGAVAAILSSSSLGVPHPEGVIALDATMRWLVSLQAIDAADPFHRRVMALVRARKGGDDLHTAYASLPAADLDHAVLGAAHPAWRAWLEHPHLDDPYWTPANHTAVGGGAVFDTPACHVTGWYDVFVDRQLEDHAGAASRGTPTRLVVGPWHHLDPRAQLIGIRVALRWLDEHLRDRPDPTPPVRVHVMEDGWHEFDVWPPETEELTVDLPQGGSFRYDPRVPTPAVGGRLLSFDAGAVDDAPLERRDDVLVLTSAPLPEPLMIAGRPRVVLEATADAEVWDCYVRLARVDRVGRSRAVSDAIARVAGRGAIEVEAHPIAWRLDAGTRLRLVVAAAAHPRYLRHPVVGDPLTAVEVGPAVTVTVRPGATVTLPVTKDELGAAQP